MKRALPLLCLLAISTTHAASWSDLWLTPDQQGQRLLDSGKPAAAARTFQDARRRAYAQIKAGQYADAAQQLEKLGDPQSNYNRGNALARGGKLENALAAYDQAIKQTPADSALGRDARHNRALVAEQLEQQQSPRDKSGGQSQSAKSQSAKNEKSQNGNQDEQQQSSSEPNAAHGSQQQNASAQGSQAEPAPQRQASTEKNQRSQGQSAAAAAVKANQDAAQAKRDAEATMAQAKQHDSAKAPQQSAQSEDPAKNHNRKPAPPTIAPPPSEQALALEQWLRQIPDDPAGLLRRKFLIEHLKREQESRR